MVEVSVSVILLVSAQIVFFFFLQQRSHFLSALLLLELIGIFILYLIPLFGVVLGESITMSVLIFLTMSACEASVGLAVLVFMVRCYGNDLMGSLSVSKF